MHTAANIAAHTTVDTRRVRQADLRTIAARASFLWERLDSPLFAIDANASESASLRWQRWIAVCGDEAQLIKRLAWDNRDAATMQRQLGEVGLTADAPLPEWVATLEQIMAAASDGRYVSEMSSLPQPQAPVPFEHILLPAMYVARRQLQARLRCLHFNEQQLPLSVLTANGYSCIERSLLVRLSNLFCDTLELEFNQSRPFGARLLHLVQTENNAPRTTEYYDAFVHSTLADGMSALLLKYPVLGRLAATAVEFWVEFVAEFLDRLQQDLPVIEATFNARTAAVPGHHRVDAIQASLSDPHHRGRTVLCLTFTSGLKLVYKPKNIDLEYAFNQLLAWCNDASKLPPFKLVRVLPRDHFGWVEYVEHLPCEGADDARSFYFQAGMLLTLLYALRTTDCHYENIIAHGRHPVLIDLETLLHHESNLIEDSPLALDAEAVSVQTFLDSVLRTGLLPRWEVSAGSSHAYDISGFGSTDTHLKPRRIYCWHDVNTDEMGRRDEQITLQMASNVPHIHGRALAPHEHQADIISGFEAMFRFLLEARPELMQPDSVLYALRRHQVRFIFRQTRTYVAIGAAAVHPQWLGDGADFSIELDHLSRAFLFAQRRPGAFNILTAELRAMEQLDVPLFSVGAAEDQLALPGLATIPGYFKGSSFDNMLQQFARLSAADLKQQVAIINGSFDAKIATTDSRQGGRWTAQQLPILQAEELREEAVRIAQRLEARAIPEGDGSVNWIGLDFIPHAERFQQMVLNSSLYDGRGGVAIFLAALGRETGEQRYSDLARAALMPLRRQISSIDLDEPALALLGRFSGLGASTGVPSMIYCLTRVGQFLGDAGLIDDAVRLMSWISPGLITSDEHLDVLSGSGGAMLCLLALHEISGNATALRLAHQCAQHLISKQIPAGAGRAWKTHWPQPLTGYSHGAAGNAYALLRLYGSSGRDEYRTAAFDAIAFEAGVFDAASNNWPDLREIGGAPDLSVVRWCHGAAGVALARVGSLRYAQSAQIVTDIDNALRATAEYDLYEVDHLCCGNFGRGEALLVGGVCRNDAELIRLARLNATNAVARARRAGAYQLFPNLPSSVFNAGFFTGVAGIGYQLLRLANPALPSVLLWE